VAAASILARASFIEQISNLNKVAGLHLPLGSSSPQVQDTARIILRRKGPDALRKLSKLHFKTISEIIPEGAS
jgi:ribonuclease HIII